MSPSPTILQLGLPLRFLLFPLYVPPLFSPLELLAVL